MLDGFLEDGLGPSACLRMGLLAWGFLFRGAASLLYVLAVAVL